MPREPRPLFLTEATTPDGETARLVAVQAPGSDRVALGVELGETCVTLQLTSEQVVGLGTQLLAANLDALGRLAERLDPEVATEVAGRLLAPVAAASLARAASPEDVQ